MVLVFHSSGFGLSDHFLCFLVWPGNMISLSTALLSSNLCMCLPMGLVPTLKPINCGKCSHGRNGSFLCGRDSEWDIFLQIGFKELLVPWSKVQYKIVSPIYLIYILIFLIYSFIGLSNLYWVPTVCQALWTQRWVKHRSEMKEAMVFMWIQKYKQNFTSHLRVFV